MRNKRKDKDKAQKERKTMSKKIKKLECDGFRTVVNPEEPFDAGEHFASVAARREFGRNGKVGALRIDSWTTDGRFTTYTAFIGRYEKRNRCLTGRNFTFIVEFEELAA